MHPCLPGHIAINYRPATDNEVRAESFGHLKAARFNPEGDWRSMRGTFDDQTIFGPKRDFWCACGKYFGRDCAEIICHLCGVKVTSSDTRRLRCAHVNLPAPILHPLGGLPAELGVLPVLPVGFIEAPGGEELLQRYDDLLRFQHDAEKLTVSFIALLETLAPALVAAHAWNLSERLLIAHGMALKEVARTHR
jgi:hypothetical protein